MSSRGGIFSSGDKNQKHDTKEKGSKSKKISITGSHEDHKDSTATDKTNGEEKGQQSNEDKFKQFENEGVVFKVKLIGSELVMEPRGDKMCQNSIQRLKAIIKGQKAHKTRVVMKISYDGVKVYDEKSNELLYQHQVPQISFISSDDSDNRAFGYVCDVPNKAHQFICFKTSGPAMQVMAVISSLFEAVLEKKKQENNKSKEESRVIEDESSSIDNKETKSAHNIKNIFDDDDGFCQSVAGVKSSMTPTAVVADPASVESSEQVKQSQQQQPPLMTKTTMRQFSLNSTMSSSPMDLIEGADSGCVDSSSTFSDWLPTQPLARPHSNAPPARHKAPAIVGRPNLLPLNTSSPINRQNSQPGSALDQLSGAQNRSLIYNHSSVSLNDAALSAARSSFASQAGLSPHNDNTDKYAVFNEMDNLPSIFESTSSLGSKTNLSHVGPIQPANDANMSLGASASVTQWNDIFELGPSGGMSTASGGFSFGNSQAGTNHLPAGLFPSPSQATANPSAGFASFGYEQQQKQQQHQQQQVQQSQHHSYQSQLPQNHQRPSWTRPAPTPSMMVPTNPAASASANASAGMTFGSAPMNAHQMSAHARFSSSMAAGLHQRLGSSAASIQSAGSAGGLSRQTNPFEDDFFS